MRVAVQRQACMNDTVFLEGALDLRRGQYSSFCQWLKGRGMVLQWLLGVIRCRGEAEGCTVCSTALAVLVGLVNSW